MLFLITLLILLIVYLATHYTRHSLRMQMNERQTWWSAVGASHFTIPILSPFTSVVRSFFVRIKLFREVTYVDLSIRPIG